MAVFNSRFVHVCTSLARRPMTMVFGLGTSSTCAHAYNFRKWRPTQRAAVGSAVNNFFDQGNFEAMKTINGWEVARCDEH